MMKLAVTPLRHWDELKEGSWIVLLRIHRPPPHLLLLHENACWSLHTGGTQQGEDSSSLFRLIERRQFPALFVRWNLPHSADAREQLSEIFAAYTRICPGGLTCLAPLRSLAVAQGVEEAAEAGFIFELLPLLQKQQQLGACIAVFVEQPEIELPVYTAADIDRAIAREVLQ
ncbi:MAG: hypothetical protein IM638_09700 [Bacteroidetes bacterium]|nr:hypothetical protein [Bacteroidota bacterium]